MLYTAIVLVCMSGGDCQYYQKENIFFKSRCESQLEEIVNTFKMQGAEVSRGACVSN